MRSMHAFTIGFGFSNIVYMKIILHLITYVCRATLARALTTVIAAKHQGYEGFLAGLVARAVVSVMPGSSARREVR